VRAALELYIVTEDLRLAQHISGMGREKFYRLVKKAKTPIVIAKRLVISLDSASEFFCHCL